MNAESFSKEQLTRNVSTTLSVSKYQRNNFHYFQTTGTTGTLLEILSEHALFSISIYMRNRHRYKEQIAVPHIYRYTNPLLNLVSVPYIL